MPTVRCEVSEGLRESERTVAVSGANGTRAYLRVGSGFLVQQGGQDLLPVGLIARDEASGAVLIELPEEADSGVSRVWVSGEDFVEYPA